MAKGKGKNRKTAETTTEPQDLRQDLNAAGLDMADEIAETMANDEATATEADAQGDATAQGHPMIHSPEIIAAIGRELAERDSDAIAAIRAGTLKTRADSLDLKERQIIKQAKRRLTLAATKAALTN